MYINSVCPKFYGIIFQIENNDPQYGVLKIQSSPPNGNTLSFSNPAYEPSAPVPVPTYKVEDIVIRGRQSASTAGGLSGIKSKYLLFFNSALILTNHRMFNGKMGNNKSNSSIYDIYMFGVLCNSLLIPGNCF